MRVKSAWKLLAVVFLSAVVTVWSYGRVKAFNPQPDPPHEFGLVGITIGQTARVNVTNLSGRGDTGLPPDPCRVTVSFYGLDGKGRSTDAANGQLPAVQRMLGPGESLHLNLNGNNLVGRGERAEIGAVVKVEPFAASGANIVPPDPCVSSFEMIDRSTGQTAFVNPGVIRGFNPQPDPPG